MLATGNSLRVARFTPLSVACAERITAINSSNGVACSSSVTGSGFSDLQPLEEFADLRRFHGAVSPGRPLVMAAPDAGAGAIA